MQNSTISGNSASARGGGIFASSGQTTIANSTITNNASNKDNTNANNQSNGGGGIYRDGGRIALANTIVAQNFDGANKRFISDISREVVGANNNLIGDIKGATGSVGTGTDIINTNARLAPLEYNGGDTRTHALFSNSPALNNGSYDAIPKDVFDANFNQVTNEPIPFDQRGNGFARIQDGRVDIGAFEGSIPTTEPPDPLLNDQFYRFQNRNVVGTYLFAGEAESQNIRQNFSRTFIEEGPAFKVSSVPKDNLIRFNRFQNRNLAGTYLFAGESESQSIRQNFSNTFVEEGVAFYALPADANIGTDYYRLRNTQVAGTYLFVGEAEKNSILANFSNFVNEGVAFEVG